MRKKRSAPKIATGSLYRPKYTYKGERIESRVWWAKYYEPGNPKPVRVSTETEDEAQAVQFLRERMAKVATIETRADRVKISQLLDMVIADYKQNKRKSTYDVSRKIETQLRPFFGNKLAAKLSTIDLKAYVKKRQGEQMTNATINREMAALHRALSIGQEEEPPLVVHIPKFDKLPEAEPREGTLDHEAYIQVRSLLPDYARLALVLSYHTGARRGELLAIRKQDIDLKAQRISLPGRTTKSGKQRYLPIYGDMKPEIEKALDAADPKCQHLIQRDGMPVGDFDKSWATACKAAGIDGALFHDLRRTALTNMIEAGLSEKEAMEISGHKTRAVFDRYSIVSDRKMKANAEKLNALLVRKQEEAERVKCESIN